MKFADWFHPRPDELRAWAAQETFDPPNQDWELVLSWEMTGDRLKHCVELAEDTSLPQAWFFLMVLYTWVSYVAKQPDFSIHQPTYERMVSQLHALTNPDVKTWRHHALRIMQGVDRFDMDVWWSRLPPRGDLK